MYADCPSDHFPTRGGGVKAQTHAEATSQKWKGIDVTTVVGNWSKYTDDNTTTSGFPFMLYNVGTGCFVIQGGNWAMEGRLFFSSFGRTMYLYNNGRINAAITEQNNVTKNSFCARPPEPQGKNWSDNTYKTANLTTLMDGDSTLNNYKMHWTFERVAGETGDTCTYYMYQKSSKVFNINPTTSSYTKYAGDKFYLGAAWGECHNTSVGKGDGRFVFMDDDRCCWTTEDVRGNTSKLQLENGDMVEIQKLYQWRIISMDEFIDVLTQDGIGLNPSISSLIPDRDFTRNSNDFFGNDGDNWRASTLSGYTYATGDYKKRYTYTWGNYKKGTNQQTLNPRVRSESWDKPLLLKAAFDKVTSTSNDDQASGKKNAKFSFLPFEGVGTVSTNFQVPKPGWYQLECVGFSMSEHDHDAYFYARVIADADINEEEKNFAIPSADEPHYGEVTMEKLPFGTYTKESYESCLEVGKELLINADDHKQKVWVQVSEADFNANKRTIRVGFRKEEATMSELTNGGYYDTDWVCADDIRATYMGLSPAFFYEDEEDLNYLSHDEADRENFTANEYVPTTLDGRYSGAASLQRTFTKGEWNTFSFPLPLTGEQVRYAFGDKSELLRLNSIGNLSNNDCIIDFETVNLLTLSNVVTAGNLYMLKPSKDPSFGENPRGEMADYYDLGKMFFSTNPADENNSEYKYPYMDLSTWSGNQPVGSFNSKNDGTGYVTYTQTPAYTSFRVSSNGFYNGTAAPEGSYVPKGSYAMSKGKMYELSRDTRIKGFRGWITLTHSIFGTSPSSQSSYARIAIDGIVEDDFASGIDTQSVVPVSPQSVTAVYDLSGRKLKASAGNLPRGMYIVGGKKLLIK